MASKKSSAKLTPATRYLRYEVTNSATPNTETSHYIDLGRDLSRVNRRLYRQGRDYHVKRITVVSKDTPNGSSRFSVSTIMDGWVSRNAWKRGFQTWTDMNKTASEQISGKITGTWSDFKVFMTLPMKTGTILNPIDNGNGAATAGEWIYSQMVTPDGTTSDDHFHLTMLGDHDGAAGTRNTVGLIRSYGESRATVSPTSPSVPSQASADPLINVFDYGTAIDEVIDLMEDDNDAPPYSQTNYPGGASNMDQPNVVQDGLLQDGRLQLNGFNALCGLIEIESQSLVAEDVFSVLVELAPGKYRGIKADVI